MMSDGFKRGQIVYVKQHSSLEQYTRAEVVGFKDGYFLAQIQVGIITKIVPIQYVNALTNKEYREKIRKPKLYLRRNADANIGEGRPS